MTRRACYAWKSILYLRLSLVALVILIMLSCYPFMAGAQSALSFNQLTHDIEAANTPMKPINYARLKDASVYNQLVSRNATYADPFHGAGDYSGSEDSAYERVLNDGAGLMGVIHIPSIAVSLPIYHGSSSLTLSHGVGHLYGTSLPVGGMNTHTVLTAHRGYNHAAMFRDVDALKQGDLIELNVEGKTLTYEVDGTRAVKPTNVDNLGIHEGMDELTLVTCTPINVNTDRLLIHAVRTMNPSVLLKPRAHRASYQPLVAGAGIGFMVSSLIGICTVKPSSELRVRHAYDRTSHAPQV